MLITFVMVAFIFIAFELMLVRQIPILKKWATDSWSFGFILSMAIGQICAMMFGLAGVLVGISTILSMLGTAAVYGMWRALSNNEDLMAAWSATKTTVRVTVKVITFPFRTVRAIKRFFKRTPSTRSNESVGII